MYKMASYENIGTKSHRLPYRGNRLEGYVASTLLRMTLVGRPLRPPRRGAAARGAADPENG